MIDLKKLYGIFTEEAAERIDDLEKGLLELEREPGNTEILNTIFRAAHTIKGSSGSIGLADISRFTHHMEEILDLMRLEKLGAGKKQIDILLGATDLIKEMVESVASETAFDFSRCSGLIQDMQRLKAPACEEGSTETVEELHIAGSEGTGQSPPPKIVLSSTRNAALYSTGAEEKHFKIIFIPGPDLFRRGLDPAMFIEELKGMGRIAGIKANSDAVPLLSDMDPEDLYLRWDIFFDTDRPEEEIRKIFEFVEDGSEIRIFSVSAPESEMPPLGRMLVEEGMVGSEDVDNALKSQKKLGEILVERGKASSKDIEKVLEKQRNRKADSVKNSIASTIRVDITKLDHLINTVGEMVIIHSMFQQSLQGPQFEVIFSQLQRIGKEIQESAMALRMLPVGDVFQRFTRLVRELSESKNKKIDLIITGEDTELDKGVLEKITDPLVHLIRNSIDHGIEDPETREAGGKASHGTIHLSAFQMGDSVYIEIEDDGRGLNKDKILEKAVSKGIIKSAGHARDMTDDQIYGLIFLPGFSTAEAVTDISGRGVGMDVVKRNIEALNGKVHIRTKLDTGTTISIKLPLTLAIIDGLKVLIGEDVFVIPITSVIESLRPGKQDVRTLNEKGEVINVRGEFIPLIRLYEELGILPWKTCPWEAIVVVVSHDGKKCGLLVDELVGQQQIVIKGLGRAVPRVTDIAGGTILGDGKVALVVDVPGVLENALVA